MEITNIQIAIFVGLGIILFVSGKMGRSTDKKLQEIIKRRYPDEWARVDREKGIKGDAMRSAMISESLKSGFLAKQQNMEIKKLRRTASLMRVISFISLVATVIFAFNIYN